MKKRRLITVLSLSITLYISLYLTACGTSTQQEPIETEIEQNIESKTLEIEENTTEQQSKTLETEFIEENTTEEITGDYPDSRSDHQANWDTYKKYFDDFSVYGTDTAGKGLNDLPYGGDTGYDPKGTILQERTTDKGYTVMYDTDTGKVYYSSMILPTGDVYLETESGGVLATYAYAKGYNNCYDITYDEMQEILGVYNGD